MVWKWWYAQSAATVCVDARMLAVVDLLDRLERYYDAVPRSAATTEEVGPLTLFVQTGAWSYYGRPRLGLTADITVDDVERIGARQRELSLPQAVDWVAETSPSLAAAAGGGGLVVAEHPLMVLDARVAAHAPDGVHLRLVEADDPGLPRIRATLEVGFSSPGTARGDPGVAELEALSGAQDVAFLRERMRAGTTRVVVAESDDGALCAGSHQPVADITEITGVATLPSARRRGIGAAVTAALVADARARGVRTIFLSAGSADVARVYERVGFRRVGTACVAEPPGDA